jgi:hypothetical protein
VILRTASVDATDDSGNRIAGPWALPLDREARKEINRLAEEFGPVTFKQKEQSCSK